jgi:hypothetical protein
VPLRLAAPLAIVALAAVLASGCGGSPSGRGSTSGAPVGAAAKSCDTHAVDVESLRATGISCSQARQVMHGWQRERTCSPRSGASRTSCLTRSYRCLGTRTDRGAAVGCARQGESIAFIARRR